MAKDLVYVSRINDTRDGWYLYDIIPDGLLKPNNKGENYAKMMGIKNDPPFYADRVGYTDWTFKL